MVTCFKLERLHVLRIQFALATVFRSTLGGAVIGCVTGLIVSFAFIFVAPSLALIGIGIGIFYGGAFGLYHGFINGVGIAIRNSFRSPQGEPDQYRKQLGILCIIVSAVGSCIFGHLASLGTLLSLGTITALPAWLLGTYMANWCLEHCSA